MAYAEHPDYVPLALRASELWDEYADLGKARLLTRCGVLGIGSPDSSLIAGIRRSALIHRLEVVLHSSDDIKREFPAFAPDEGHIGLLEPKAGWIDSNAAIGTALQIAKLNGATLRLANPVLNWAYDQGSFEITTVSDRVVAKGLVITAGAWSAQFLQQLGLPLTLQRKVLTWIDPIEPRLFQPGAFPVFVSSEGFLYGFPALGEQGVKLAVHWTPGQTVADPNEPVPEAILDDAGEPLAMASRLLPQLAGRLPDALQRVKRMKTCLYVMSPDEHFFVDRHPEWPGLVFAAGFSGHGFKFAPVIGEILADMATSSVMKLPIDFLRIARLSKSSEN
jgi:sarcosine oxidase